MLNAIDRGIVTVIRATDKWWVVSTVTNLTIIFFKIIDPFVSGLLYYAGITGYRYTQTFMYLKAKPILECFFLLFPWVGNSYVKSHRKYYDLKTINNNPQCLGAVIRSYQDRKMQLKFVVDFLCSENFEHPRLNEDKLIKIFPELDFVNNYKQKNKCGFIQEMIDINPNVLKHPHIFEQISEETGMGIFILNTILMDDTEFAIKLFKRAPNLMIHVNGCKNLDLFKNLFAKMDRELLEKCLEHGLKSKPELFLKIDEDLKKDPSFLIFCAKKGGSPLFKCLDETTLKNILIAFAKNKNTEEAEKDLKDYLSVSVADEFENLSLFFKIIDELSLQEDVPQLLNTYISKFKKGELLTPKTISEKPNIFEFIDVETKKDKKLIAPFLMKNPKVASYILPSEIDDTENHPGYLEFIVELAHKIEQILPNLPVVVCRNKEMIGYLLKNIDWKKISYNIPPLFWERIYQNLNIDQEYMLSLMSLYPDFLTCAINSSQGRVWLEDFLKFITTSNLKENLQIIEQLMELTSHVFSCLPINVRTDKNSIKILLECVGLYWSKKSENEIEFKAENNLPCHLWQCLNTPLNVDIDIVIEFFKIEPHLCRTHKKYVNLPFLTTELFENKELAEKCLEYIISEKKLESSTKYLEALLYASSKTLEHLSNSIRKNENFICYLSEALFKINDPALHRNAFPYFLKGIDPTLKENLDFVQRFVKINFDLFNYLPELRKNKELVKRLVVHNPEVVKYITIEDLNDPSQNAFNPIQLYSDFIEELYRINSKIMDYVDYRAFETNYFNKKFADKDNFFGALCRIKKIPFLRNRITIENKWKTSLNKKALTLILCNKNQKKLPLLAIHKILSFLWAYPEKQVEKSSKKISKSKINQKEWTKAKKKLDNALDQIEYKIKNLNQDKLLFNWSFCNKCSKYEISLKRKLIKRRDQKFLLIRELKIRENNSKFVFPKICCTKCANDI